MQHANPCDCRRWRASIWAAIALYVIVGIFSLVFARGCNDGLMSLVHA
jgi:predicted benzoate:H+ symporter BenE